jgi:hypothetical protein
MANAVFKKTKKTEKTIRKPKKHGRRMMSSTVLILGVETTL